MASLLSLPPELLIRICQELCAESLVRLGQVCHPLRAVARDAHAWERTTLDLREPHQRYGILRIAPVLFSVEVWFDGEGRNDAWPDQLDVTAGTPRVRQFSLDWNARSDGDYNAEQLIRTLQHFRGHLEVVKLGSLQSVQVLKCIDELGVKELYVEGRHVRCYCGRGSHVVRELSLGCGVSGDVACLLLRANQGTLTKFELETGFFQETTWFFAMDESVPRAIERCSKLEDLSAVLWSEVAFLYKLPSLKRLTMLELDGPDHDSLAQFFASPVAAQLTFLMLHMDSLSHRGILRAVAGGCALLESLTVTSEVPGTAGRRCYAYVDTPRDLHRVLDPLPCLETLKISCCRIPSMVFEGMERGALSGLKELVLDDCRATRKGLDALASLKRARPQLRVSEDIYAPEEHEREEFQRCGVAPCDALSDCEDEDPL